MAGLKAAKEFFGGVVVQQVEPMPVDSVTRYWLGVAADSVYLGSPFPQKRQAVLPDKAGCSGNEYSVHELKSGWV